MLFRRSPAVRRRVRRRAWQRNVDLSPAVADTPVVAANPTRSTDSGTTANNLTHPTPHVVFAFFVTGVLAFGRPGRGREMHIAVHLRSDLVSVDLFFALPYYSTLSRVSSPASSRRNFASDDTRRFSSSMAACATGRTVLRCAAGMAGQRWRSVRRMVVCRLL